MDTSPDGLRIIDSLERDFTNLRVIDAALKASLIQRLDELREIVGGDFKPGCVTGRCSREQIH